MIDELLNSEKEYKTKIKDLENQLSYEKNKSEKLEGDLNQKLNEEKNKNEEKIKELNDKIKTLDEEKIK